MGKVAAYIGLLFLLSAFMLLVISINSGKRIAGYLKRKYPKKWEGMGKPTPGYMNSTRMHSWTRFIMHREYLEFGDMKLEEMGKEQRLLEMITIGLVVAFVIISGGAFLLIELAG